MDAETLRKAMEGDEPAKGELFLAAVRYIAIRFRRAVPIRLRSRFSSEDLAGEVLIAACEKFDHSQFESIDAFKGWLATLARQRLIDEQRREFSLKRECKRTSAIHFDIAYQPGSECEANDLRRFLLSGLDLEESTIIEMIADGWTTPDVSTATGWHIRRIQRLLARRRRLLEAEVAFVSWMFRPYDNP